MGLNNRESRLVDRVKDVENQNRFLRRQLSISQGQIMKSAIIKKQNKLKRQHNQRRSAIDQSYNTNNNINYDTGGVMDDVDEQKHANEVLYPSVTVCPIYSTLGSYTYPKTPKVN